MVEGAKVNTGITVSLNWRDQVAIVTINRPERRNALDVPTLHALRQAQLDALEKSARVLVLTGVPPAFCAGADLGGVHENEFHEALQVVLRGFTQLPFVTMAAVDGPALGAGAQLLVACDVRVATPTSVIGVPAAKLGLVVNHWTVERIVHELSWPVARAMLLTATTYTGAQLAAFGSVHRLGTLDDALAWASEIAQLAPLTISGHKIALESTAGLPDVDELVRAAREKAMLSSDAQEGRTAFAEKRKPRFVGS
jgi:enoyl-CoA hydratase